MFCIQDFLCIPTWALWALGILAAVILLMAVGKWVFGITTQSEDKPYPNSITSSEYTPQTGQKFSYFDEPLSPQFVVTDIDREENELGGYIEIPLPVGAEAIDVSRDFDNDVFVKYRLPDGKFVNKFWRLDEDPEELDDWYISWTEVIAIPQ